jgi:hypothetical protein
MGDGTAERVRLPHRRGSASDDRDHQRPPGLGNDTVAAVGELDEALEWLERARDPHDLRQGLGHFDRPLSGSRLTDPRRRGGRPAHGWRPLRPAGADG